MHMQESERSNSLEAVRAKYPTTDYLFHFLLFYFFIFFSLVQHFTPQNVKYTKPIFYFL